MRTIEFTPWPKIPRLFRDAVVTEKIDGTNAAIGIVDAGEAVSGGITSSLFVPFDETSAGLIYAQSRRRIITPEDDNYGFARWVYDNAADLVRVLGEGVHFGEWWGSGVRRGYGLTEKRFSLFNTKRWSWLDNPEAREARNVPAQLHCVPTLGIRTFSLAHVQGVMDELREKGSQAAPGFMNPEGIVLYHTAAGAMFKALLENDDKPKGGE